MAEALGRDLVTLYRDQGGPGGGGRGESEGHSRVEHSSHRFHR
jgi:hypothetical protein